ncbi:APC family permease [Gordonia sp. NPDC003376]
MTDSTIPTRSSADPTEEPREDGLKAGTVGTTHIVSMVVAAAAPIASAVTLIPLGMLLGNGIGMPGTILLVSLVLGLFSVGFVKILPFIKNTGAFYAFVSAGLGKPAGLASAYVLAAVYTALGASVVGAFGYYGADLLSRFFGLDVPWLLVALVAVVLATLLAISGVTMTARLLLGILSLELAALIVLDIAILIQQGLPSFSLEVFEPSNIFTGAMGVAAIYAFSMFLGFEGTAIYSEEARDHRRTVPRATFIVVALVGVFYTFTSWSMVAAVGTHDLVATIAEDPGAFSFGLSDRFVGTGWTDLITVLNTISLFAGMLAFQNAGARYLFALARDGMAPRALARTHRTAGTPVTGLVAIGAVFVVLATVYRVSGLSPLLDMSTSLVGLGTVGLVSMLAVASVSIAVFFLRRGEIGATTVVAPLVAAALLGYCIYAGITNYSALTGVSTWWVNNLPWVLVPIALGGLGYAFWVRSARADRYSGIGKTRV